MSDPHQYIFTSEKLGYRLLTENDLDNYAKLDSNPEVRAFSPSTLDIEHIKNNIDYFYILEAGS